MAQDIVRRLAGFFAKDKEVANRQLAKGSTSDRFTGGALSVLTGTNDPLAEYLRLDHDLVSRYADYEEMDDYGMISVALDVLSDDATQPDSSLNRTLWVTSKDKALQRNLDDMFNRTLRMDEEAVEIARTLVKYGSNFEEMLVTKEGVRGLNFLPPATIRRVEGPKGELFGFVQDFSGKFDYSVPEYQQALSQRIANGPAGGSAPYAALEGWEVVHFRLRGKNRRSVYGSSSLDSARWIWKRLVLLEDSALIYRLQRAPERFAFYVNTGDMPPREALAYLNKVRQEYKKKKFVDPSTGKLNLRFESLPVAHDTPIPLLDGRTIPISQMTEEHKAGVKHWVYSIDRATGKPVPGEVEWADRTRTASPAVRILFDDGGVATMAPDHPVMLRDCTYVEAQHLKPNDAVMPFYRAEGAQSFEDYKEQVRQPTNHRVVSVEVVEPTDHYCMSVKTWHNFAIMLRGPDGEVLPRSGVYVRNSPDEDFFVPTRNGQDQTRIENLGAPSWQAVEDILYFRDLLFAAIKVPRAYLGQEADVNRATISNVDVRFARSVLRIQRELKNGFRKIARTHLSAQDIDPAKAEFDLNMTVPSSIFELAQMEVRTARSDLAGRMREFVSMHWILSKIFGMSDSEIEEISKQRGEDAGAEAAIQQAAMGAAPGASPEGGDQGAYGPPEEESAARGPLDLAERVAASRARARARRIPAGSGIPEQELFRGDRRAERRAEGKLDELLARDGQMRGKLNEIKGLVSDIRFATGRPRK